MGLVTDLVHKSIDVTMLMLSDLKAPRNYMGASGLGETCDAKLWYGYKHPKPVTDARVLRIFELGHLLEEYVIRLLREAGYTVFTVDDDGKQFGFTDGIIGGSCDGVIMIDGRPYLLEIKSANDKRFTAMKKEGVHKSDPVYYTQFQVYAEKLELENILFVAINKNTCELHFEKYIVDPIEANWAVNRGKEIGESVSRPSRKYDHKSNFNCKFCNYREECWAEVNTGPG